MRGSQVGSAPGANAASAICKYAETRPLAPPPAIFSAKSIGKTSSPSATAAIGAQTIATDAAIATPIARGARRQPYSARTPGPFQKPRSSQRRCAPSTAANIAPTTPMPRPAAMSILTPAS